MAVSPCLRCASQTLRIGAISSRALPSWRVASPRPARFLSSSSSSSSVRDPNHPTGIWYHPVPNSDSSRATWAVSLLSKPPTEPDSASVMGFVSGASGQKDVHPDQVAANEPSRFQSNKKFTTLLHHVIKTEIVPHDQMLDFEAQNRESGWLHVTDNRHALMPGRIATPENILASVAFVNSKIEPDSYEINDTYRLLTKEEGWMQLREEWLTVLHKHLEKVN